MFGGAMSKNRLKLLVAEVSIDDTIQEYSVVARTNVEARDLVVRHLGSGHPWSRIRVRSTSGTPPDGPSRVLGKL